MAAEGRIDLSKPRYDQSTYGGRLQHYFEVTDPRTVLASDADLDKAASLVKAYNAGTEPKGTSADDVWAAKKLYDSAFHPQTGEKNLFIGRMSFQVPGNMMITGGMMAVYKSVPLSVMFQFLNQSFNAIVNYTNRNASSEITTETLATAYVAATTASVASHASDRRGFQSRDPTPSRRMVGRFVPLVAVAGANCVNIPLIRQTELKEGITVTTKDGREIGKSQNAAFGAVTQVIPSRILMAMPSMGLTPVVMAAIESRGLLSAAPFLTMPVTVLVTGLALVVSTPMACAIFPQDVTPYTLHPTPYTPHPTPYTLHPTYTLHTPYTLLPTPYTLHPTPYTLHPTPHTLHPAPCTLHPAPCTLHLILLNP
ncbi:Tricarboxylate carrier-domain-containing protein [Baffinella frigidus]|nr:Tricarboxylate carrier-domain-containing protein [Cryptophyta sp. CCMP2293]